MKHGTSKSSSPLAAVYPVLIAVVLGAIAGLTPAIRPLDPILKILGDVFLLGLKMVVPPLMFASIVVGVGGLAALGNVRKVAGTTALYFAVSMGLAVALGLTLVNLIRPGDGVALGVAGAVPEAAMKVAEMTPLSFLHHQIREALENPFSALADGHVLAIIVFAVLLGGALSMMGKRGRPVLAWFDGINEAMLSIALLVIRLAPVGAFSLLTLAVASGGWAALASLGKYALTVVLGLAIHASVTLPLLVKFWGGVSPLAFYRAMRPAAAVAFATSSSNATLPVTLTCVRSMLRIPAAVAEFVCPLGATANMNGTALYEAVAAVFIAQAYGIDLSIGQQVIVFVTATLAAIGAAGIPGAGLVTMALVLKAVGLPLEGLGLILAVDRILDMCRTAVNVCDDGAGCVIVARQAVK